MKLIFACFICITQRRALRIVMKRQFYIYNCRFCISIYSWDNNASALEINGCHVGILLPVSILTLLWPAACDFASATATYHNYGKTKFHSNRTTHSRVMTSYGFFKLVASASHMYFRLPVWWSLTSKKMQNCFHSKVRYDISICGWYTTTSGFGNKRPWYWNSTSSFDFALHCHRHPILHRLTKFYANWTISDRVLTLCRFFKTSAIPSQIYVRFLVCDISDFRT